MRGEEGVREELDTVMGSGGALSRQNHGRGRQRDAHVCTIRDLGGHRGNLLRRGRDAVSGSTFSAVY